MTTTTKITHLNGIEVIAVEPAIGTHPRWPNRPALRTGVVKLLLADGKETYLCTDCNEFTAETADKVSHHRNGTHLRGPAKPLTPEATIRAVLRAVESAKQRRIRGYAEAAAEQLNKTELRPVQGGDWTAGVVSNLYSAYRGKYRVHLAERSSKTDRVRARIENPAGLPPFRDLVDYCGLDRATLVRLRDHLQNAVALVEQMIDAPPPPQVIDRELADKARKYDDLVKRLLG